MSVGILLALATAIMWGSREILLRKAFEATRPVYGVFVTVAATFIISDVDRDEWRWQKGIAYALLAGLMWSVTNLLTRFGFAEHRFPMTALAIASGVPLLPMVFYLISRDIGVGMLSDMKRSRRLVSGCFLSALGQVTLFAALSFAPTIYVVPTYNLKSVVTVILAYMIIPKSERINTRVILGAILAIAGIVLINL